MLQPHIFNLVLYGFMISAVLFFIVLFFIPAPYGRYDKKGWGAQINSRLAWILMESPTIWLFLWMFLISPRPFSVVGIVFMVIWYSHYAQRVLMFPFLIRENKGMPVLIALMAFVFQLANVYLQAGWIYHLSARDLYTIEWLTDIRFILGVAVFITGYIINRWADTSLRRLREQNKDSYSIPRGGLYEWISCPNYLGEIMIWAGWAIMTWSLAGLAFLIWTIANLLPRAYMHHKWYHKTFEDYPQKRKALIPFIL